MMAYPPPVPPGPSNSLFTASEASALDGFLDDFAAADPLTASAPASSANAFFQRPPAIPPHTPQPGPIPGSAKVPRTPYSAGLEHLKAYQPQAYIEHFAPSRPTGQNDIYAPSQGTPNMEGGEISQSQVGQASFAQGGNPDREARMRQQAMELSAWMSARGISSAPTPHPTTAAIAVKEANENDAGGLALDGQRQPQQPPRPAQQAPSRTHEVQIAPVLMKVTPAPSTSNGVSSILPATPIAPQATAKAETQTKSAKAKGKSKQEDGSTTAGKREKALLSHEQKRANHIASEQKRRAAIRQGYDRLCEVVPSLRCAVRDWETDRGRSGPGGVPATRGGSAGSDSEDVAGAGQGSDGAGAGTGSGAGGEGGARKKRKKREDGGDGRAGPKSEATVLARTVEHLRDLDAERADMLSRLATAHAIAQKRGLRVDNAPRQWELPWSADLAGDVDGAS